MRVTLDQELSNHLELGGILHRATLQARKGETVRINTEAGSFVLSLAPSLQKPKWQPPATKVVRVQAPHWFARIHDWWMMRRTGMCPKHEVYKQPTGHGWQCYKCEAKREARLRVKILAALNRRKGTAIRVAVVLVAVWAVSMLIAETPFVYVQEVPTNPEGGFSGVKVYERETGTLMICVVACTRDTTNRLRA
jgi:hypothetical protein